MATELFVWGARIIIVEDEIACTIAREMPISSHKSMQITRIHWQPVDVNSSPAHPTLSNVLTC